MTCSSRVAFVDSRLKRLAGLLLGHLGCRRLRQLVVDQRPKLLRRLGVAFFDGVQDLRNVGREVSLLPRGLRRSPSYADGRRFTIRPGRRQRECR